MDTITASGLQCRKDLEMVLLTFPHFGSGRVCEILQGSTNRGIMGQWTSASTVGAEFSWEPFKLFPPPSWIRGRLNLAVSHRHWLWTIDCFQTERKMQLRWTGHGHRSSLGKLCQQCVILCMIKERWFPFSPLDVCILKIFYNRHALFCSWKSYV